MRESCRRLLGMVTRAAVPPVPAGNARSGVGDRASCYVWFEEVGQDTAAGVLARSTPHWLTPGETRRWSAYRQPADRARFAAGVALQHRALVELTGVDAPLIRLCPGCGSDEHGPVAAGGDLTGTVAMSLSHSGHLIAVVIVPVNLPGHRSLAVDRGPSAPVRVGIDVESCRSLGEGVEDLVCTPDEAAADAAEPDPRCALMTRWTRKEAVLKAQGVGLMVPMSHVIVSPASQPPGVVAVTEHPRLAGLTPESAHLMDIVHRAMGEKYHVSVCVVGAAAAANLWQEQASNGSGARRML